MHSFQNHHQTTMPEYNGSSFSFMPSISHGLPSESLHRMPPPPPPHSMAQAQQTTLPQLPPQLPMLVMPSHATWPSMLTNPNSYSSHSAPSMSIPPIQVAPRVQGSSMKTKLPALHTQPVPRKTLTDDDRKRMCQYAEDHPHAKQTDIGARFGVERRLVDVGGGPPRIGFGFHSSFDSNPMLVPFPKCCAIRRSICIPSRRTARPALR